MIIFNNSMIELIFHFEYKLVKIIAKLQFN